MTFYAYILRDPRTNTPFYVGKGAGQRIERHLRGKSHNRGVRMKIESIRRARCKPVAEVIYALDESHAFLLEECLIEVIGRRDLSTGPLFNETAGGEGSAGRRLTHSEATKARISASLKGRIFTAEHRANMSAAAKGRPGPSPAVQAKSAESMRRPEVRAKLSAAAKRTVTPERLAQMTALAALATRGKPKSPEHRAKIGAAHKGRVPTPEARARMSEGQKRRYAK